MTVQAWYESQPPEKQHRAQLLIRLIFAVYSETEGEHDFPNFDTAYREVLKLDTEDFWKDLMFHSAVICKKSEWDPDSVRVEWERNLLPW